jgi:hypothetical protein
MPFETAMYSYPVTSINETDVSVLEDRTGVIPVAVEQAAFSTIAVCPLVTLPDSTSLVIRTRIRDPMSAAARV